LPVLNHHLNIISRVFISLCKIFANQLRLKQLVWNRFSI